jgi:mono/diheme cytochrome c family protein
MKFRLNLSIPTDAQALRRGEHLATIFICTRCHTENLGGELSFAVPGMVTIPTPNLTSGAGGIGSSYTDEDWVRAIRHGVGHDGRALFVMPSNAFHSLNDEDLGAVIAYLKSVPPVDNQLAERRIELMGRLMMAVGMFPPLAVDRIDHASPPPAGPEPGVSVAYGIPVRTCTECHGAQLNGAPFDHPARKYRHQPDPEALAAWTGRVITAMRTGVTPGVSC